MFSWTSLPEFDRSLAESQAGCHPFAHGPRSPEMGSYSTFGLLSDGDWGFMITTLLPKFGFYPQVLKSCLSWLRQLFLLLRSDLF